jgi:putative hydrolase of the HAD superfamily
LQALETSSQLRRLQQRDAMAHVDTWVFDLDNTLYPADSDLWPKIDARITAYLAELFGLDGLSSREVQKYYYHRYGTSLRGLMDEGALPDVGEFLDFVHDIDRSSLRPDTALSEAIGALEGRKLIFTNGSRRHAEETAEALGILQHFDGISDIVSSRFDPKPGAGAYQRFFTDHGVDPRRAVMFEDLSKNLLVPRAEGMRTVLVVPRIGQVDHRDASEREFTRPEHVDFMTDNLAGFLTELLPRR